MADLAPRQVVWSASRSLAARDFVFRIFGMAWVPPCHWGVVTSRGPFIGGMN